MTFGFSVSADRYLIYYCTKVSGQKTNVMFDMSEKL